MVFTNVRSWLIVLSTSVSSITKISELSSSLKDSSNCAVFLELPQEKSKPQHNIDTVKVFFKVLFFIINYFFTHLLPLFQTRKPILFRIIIN